MVERLPALMTVEEAARVLRIGRTKAYAMARQWRATGGRSGLPVVDFGHVLRVPRQALENFVGAELRDAAADAAAGNASEITSGSVAVTETAAPAPVRPVHSTTTTPTTSRTKHTRRSRQQLPGQTSLPLTT